MRCNQAQRQHIHSPSAQNLITAVEELHEALGRIPYAPVGQALLRDFAERHLGVDLLHLVSDEEDPADGPGVEEDD
jgi:hypothetical protein